jgi:hypothetical protein
VRGVRSFGSAEGTQKNIREATSREVEAYTSKQISAVLRRLKLSGLEDTIIQGLKQ